MEDELRGQIEEELKHQREELASQERFLSQLRNMRTNLLQQGYSTGSVDGLITAWEDNAAHVRNLIDRLENEL